nr:MAG TPA: hypothetical protein [Caudoviricetes sp.]
MIECHFSQSWWLSFSTKLTMSCELSPAVISPHFTARIILGYMRLLTAVDGNRR